MLDDWRQKIAAALFRSDMTFTVALIQHLKAMTATT
jgi:hypothetical protein